MRLLTDVRSARINSNSKGVLMMLLTDVWSARINLNSNKIGYNHVRHRWTTNSFTATRHARD